MKAVVGSSLHEVVDDLIKALIFREHAKKKTVWMWGPADTGKTTLCDFVQAIFECDEYQALPGSSHHKGAKEGNFKA